MGKFSPHMEPALCSGIILSDSVIREEGTGKMSLIGCFTVWNAQQFPLLVAPFYVTALLTNLRGNVEQIHVTVRLENPQNGHVLTSVSGNMRPGEHTFDPNEVFEIPFPIKSVAFPSAGMYAVIVLVDNEAIGKRAIAVRSLTAGTISDMEKT